MKKTIKLFIIVLVALSLGGCTFSQSKINDKNIIEFKKCQDAGMAAGLNGFNEVSCVPK